MPQPWPPWPEEPPPRNAETVAKLFFRHEDQGLGPLATGRGTLSAPFIAYLLQRERPWVFTDEHLQLLFSATGNCEMDVHFGCGAFSRLLGFEDDTISLDFYLGCWLNKDWSTRDDRYIIDKRDDGSYVLEAVKSGQRWQGPIRRDGSVFLADIKQVSGEPLNPNPQTVRLNLEGGVSADMRQKQRRTTRINSKPGLNVGMITPTEGPDRGTRPRQTFNGGGQAAGAELDDGQAGAVDVKRGTRPRQTFNPTNKRASDAGIGGTMAAISAIREEAEEGEDGGAGSGGGAGPDGVKISVADGGAGSADGGSRTGSRGANSIGDRGGSAGSSGVGKPTVNFNIPGGLDDGRGASKQSALSDGDGGSRAVSKEFSDVDEGGPKADVLVSSSKRPNGEVWSREEIRRRSMELDEDGYIGQYISDQFGVRFSIVRAGDGSLIIHWLQYTAVLVRDRPWMFGHSMGADGKARKKIRVYPVEDGSGWLHMQYLEEKKQTWVQPVTKMRPLTKEEIEADGRYVATDSLWQALSSGDTVLLKGRWLMERGELDDPLPRRQDLPPEAIWDPKQLEVHVRQADVLVVAISYCWEEEDHPDPYGRQLEILAGVIKERLALRYPNGRPALMDVAIWIDWCSLYQRPYADDAERNSFQKGLEDCYLWFAHQTSECWLIQTVAGDMVEYDQRGWPYFEVEISSMITPQHMLINIGKWRSNLSDWFRLYQACKMDRSVPETPADFLEDLRLKVFKHPEDLNFLEKKYSEVFTQVMGAAQVLSFSDITHWGIGNDIEHSDWVLLAHMLPLCRSLRRFSMVNDQMDGESFKSMAEVLPQCTAMKVLELSSNPLGDVGVIALAESLPNIPNLEMLVLEDCGIKDEGAKALAAALPKCATLQELWLAHNEIGNGGGVAFAGSLAGCPTLRVLLLSDNQIGGQTAKRLHMSWVAAGKLDEDDEHYNLEV